MSYLKPIDESMLRLYRHIENAQLVDGDLQRLAAEIMSLRKVYEAVRWYELGGARTITEQGGPAYDPVKSWKHVKLTIQAHDNLIGRDDG